jgi:hypothetical protein
MRNSLPNQKKCSAAKKQARQPFSHPTYRRRQKSSSSPIEAFYQTFQPSNLPTFLSRPFPRSIRHGINDSPCTVTSIETSPSPIPLEMRHPFLQLPTDLENQSRDDGYFNQPSPWVLLLPPTPASAQTKQHPNERTNGRMNQRRLCNDAYTSCPCMHLNLQHILPEVRRSNLTQFCL